MSDRLSIIVISKQVGQPEILLPRHSDDTESYYMEVVSLVKICGVYLDSFVLQEITDLLAFQRTLSNVCEFEYKIHMDRIDNFNALNCVADSIAQRRASRL